MNEQQLRVIAETAFKRQFADLEIVRIDIRQGLGFEDDSPVVDVNIVYDDESGRVTGHGLLDVLSEVVDEAWEEGKHDLGYPLVHLIAKSGFEQDPPATV